MSDAYHELCYTPVSPTNSPQADKGITELYALQTLAATKNSVERKMLQALGYKVLITESDYPELANETRIPQDPAYVRMYACCRTLLYVSRMLCFAIETSSLELDVLVLRWDPVMCFARCL